MKKIDPEFVAAAVRRAVSDCRSARRNNPEGSDNSLLLFDSAPVNAIKNEIVRAGRKLWDRQYVDGNGGNISVRISPRYVVCTPTMCSKADLLVDELALVDMDNCQVCGSRPQTSEIRLHIEIYKAVPKARAVIHCHPPYATAHAIAGIIPQGNLLPEQEVFVGPVALTPYETPGTIEFARTILPVAKRHNTILLANHGIVCWADTIERAEWLTEIIETYCKTIMIASQLRLPLPEIPANKVTELLAIKTKLDLPDARLPEDPSCTSGQAQVFPADPASDSLILDDGEVDRLISSLTAEILDHLAKGNEEQP